MNTVAWILLSVLVLVLGVGLLTFAGAVNYTRACESALASKMSDLEITNARMSALYSVLQRNNIEVTFENINLEDLDKAETVEDIFPEAQS